MHIISTLSFFVTPAFSIELDSEVSATNGDQHQSATDYNNAEIAQAKFIREKQSLSSTSVCIKIYSSPRAWISLRQRSNCSYCSVISTHATFTGILDSKLFPRTWLSCFVSCTNRFLFVRRRTKFAELGLNYCLCSNQPQSSAGGLQNNIKQLERRLNM